VTATALDATPRLVAMVVAKLSRAVEVNVVDVRPASVMLLATLYSVIVGGAGVEAVVLFFFKPAPRPAPRPTPMHSNRMAPATHLPLPFAGCCGAPPGCPPITATTTGLPSITGIRVFERGSGALGGRNRPPVRKGPEQRDTHSARVSARVFPLFPFTRGASLEVQRQRWVPRFA
jgi:hypothetical protein